MSFTQEVKRELATLTPASEHCRRAELSGMLFGAGTFDIGPGGSYGVRVTLTLGASVRHLLALLKPYQVEVELRTMSAPPVGKRYELFLGDDPRSLQLLNELGVVSDSLRLQMTVPRRIVERHCCLVSFLRGVFLGCGSISAPGSPVHVELTVEDSGLAEQVQSFLARLELGFKLAARDRNIACYSKRSDTAADLLAILGAHDARLRWEEHAVLGRVRESANRMANCDEANARRAAAAGERQAEAVRRLKASAQWAALPAPLRAAAELRLRSPYLSLQELAEQSLPPVSRSALNHRLRRLVALAEEEEGPAPR